MRRGRPLCYDLVERRMGMQASSRLIRQRQIPIPPMLMGLAAAGLLVHFAGSGHYGFFRDELYFIACGEHLAWGYVDQPPLIAVIARLSRILLGDSLFAFRFFPAVAGVCTVLLTGAVAREFGGGRFAQVLAGLTILLAPACLAFGSFLSMNAFEPLLWTACAWVLIRILNGADQRLWVLFGVIAGIGLLNKHTMLVFGFAIAAGLLLTPARTQLRSKWLWLGGLAAFGIFLPNLFWMWQHNWPQIEVVRNGQMYKNTDVGPLRFLGEQFLFLNPVAAPLIVAGFGWLMISERGRRFRCMGLTTLAVIAAVMALRGKTYYPLPAYPVVAAAGGVCLEWALRDLRRRWLRLAYPATLVVSGIIMLPYGVPVLPIEAFLRYEDALPLAHSVKVERDSDGELPQLYADMFGWENMTATVAAAYHSLPPQEQAQCAILAGNYGEAGAIDFFGPGFGLPKAISGHNNYYLWGPRSHTGEVVILFGERAEAIKLNFEEVERVATISNRHAMMVENNLPVYVCRYPKIPLSAIWPTLRFYF